MASEEAPIDGSDADSAQLYAGAAADVGAVATPGTSRVVYFGRLPQDITESEIATLGIPFGRMRSLVISRKKFTAFLEMEESEAAQRMCGHFAMFPPFIRGSTLHVNLSSYLDFKVDHMTQAAQTAVADASSQADQYHRNPPSPVLCLRIDNVRQENALTLDVLYQLFSKCGIVQRIVIFTGKQGQYQALVEMRDNTESLCARLLLHGQNVYDNSCTLNLDFSKNNSLDVRQNTDRQRDFTRALPSGPAQRSGGDGGQVARAGTKRTNTGAPVSQGGILQGAGMGGIQSSQGLISLPQGMQFSQQGLQQGMAMPMGMPLGPGTPQLQQIAPGVMAMVMPAPQMGSMGAMPQMHMPPPSQAGQPQMLGSAPSALVGLTGQQGSNGSGNPREMPSRVVLVVGINPEKLTPDDIFLLLGVYGDVHRVKMHYHKPDTAFVQFSTVEQAERATKLLHGQQVFGRRLRVFYSHLQEIQLHQAQTGPDGQPLTAEQYAVHDYTSSPLHRFRGVRNFQNIFSPSHVLHVSNIIPTTSEEDIRSLFTNLGLEIKSFKFIGEGRHMAFVELTSPDDAIIGLIKVHNSRQGDPTNGAPLRISFARPLERGGGGGGGVPRQQQQPQQQQQQQPSA